jgi:hypothetical protein
MGDPWVTVTRVATVRHAAREQATADFVSGYTFLIISRRNFLCNPTRRVWLSGIISNGIDMLKLLLGAIDQNFELRAWLYPMRLADRIRVAFRAVLRLIGQLPSERCVSSGSLDLLHHGELPADFLSPRGRGWYSSGGGGSTSTEDFVQNSLTHATSAHGFFRYPHDVSMPPHRN